MFVHSKVCSFIANLGFVVVSRVVVHSESRVCHCIWGGVDGGMQHRTLGLSSFLRCLLVHCFITIGVRGAVLLHRGVWQFACLSLPSSRRVLDLDILEM